MNDNALDTPFTYMPASETEAKMLDPKAMRLTGGEYDGRWSYPLLAGRRLIFCRVGKPELHYVSDGEKLMWEKK